MKKTLLLAVACVAALIAGVAIYAGAGDNERRDAALGGDKPTPPAGPRQSDSQAPDRSTQAPQQSPRSERAVEALQARVARQAERDGFEDSWAVSLDQSGNIRIQTNAAEEKIRSVMDLPDAAQKNEVSKANIQRGVTIQDNWHRRDDIPAFWGGAGLTNGSGLCSAGYAARRSSGQIVSVSAGHCFALNQTVSVESGARAFGTVVVRQLASLGNGPVDYELIGGQSYAPYVYTGGVTSTTSQPVRGAGGAVQGFNDYCHSGRTTGQSCGHTATSTSAQVCTQSGCKSPVIEFTGGSMIQGGDSGGTFYAKGGDGTGVFIRGNTIASRSDGSAGWAQPWTVIASRESLTIVTAS